jgi:hypothetical protein
LWFGLFGAEPEDKARSAVAIAATAHSAAPFAATSASATTGGAGLSFVDADRASFQISAVELLDCVVSGLIRRHLDEAESSRAIRCAVDYHLRTLDLAGLAEGFLQVLIGHSPSQIAHIQSTAH